MNHIESIFAEMAQNRGWIAYRDGWPDFMLIKNGKPCFVEVKSADDRLHASQVRMFQALERTGTTVYVWWAHQPDTLLPWKKFRKLRLEHVPGATREDAANALGLSERGVKAVRSGLRVLRGG